MGVGVWVGYKSMRKPNIVILRLCLSYTMVASLLSLDRFIMELIDELDKTIKLLESEIPANPASEKNEKLEKRMERSLSQYFKGLNQAIDLNALEQIYYRNVKQE